MHDAVMAEFGDGYSENGVGNEAFRLEDVNPDVTTDGGLVELQSQQRAAKNAVEA